ncbi:PAS domain-containing protein [Rhodobacteraceae bacterium 2CG4]|uniref:histidine kinase n=1 Tax=Halovulum marinum TaxID=2662447 RepID=A0A6L5YYD4_9RHOB|nr:CheR family methyltransferase [Halovulum marinum]MSU89218.1 PAS domain-containing protein [Halovulum marinum]
MTSQNRLVVGIGASAGGIPALEGFFHALPGDSGMAFVIVTHLSPDRRSQLHEIIGRLAPIPVRAAEDGAQVRADHVYVMPEGKVLTISGGRLCLSDDDPMQRERKPIDVFFASLAEDQREHAVGIVLSGGDSDGTLGVKAIKARGGITMAQVRDGSGPRNPQMPESALASGFIDFAEPVEHMAERLLQIQRGADPLVALADGAGDRQADEIEELAQATISRLLHSQSGHDFSGYKRRTFMRRVARRMKVVQAGTLDAYVQKLREEPAEVLALFRDMLISVTDFFRDCEAFQALDTSVLPRLFESRGAGDTIRVWVPGCATGEEVYSLAILLRERMDGPDPAPNVQIFATDIDEEVLAVARAGRYPEALLRNVAPERLERFFRREGGSYVVRKEIRDLCVFAPHSVISDPPFSRIDLVSCRNLLIYLGGTLQNQVIPTFHYALRPGGFLFLGTSEGVSRHDDLFAPVDKKHRIFQSRDHGGRLRRLPIAINRAEDRSGVQPAGRERLDRAGLRLRQRIEAQVLERHSPAHVVVAQDEEIVFFSSNTGRYLTMPRGAPHRKLFDLARRELRADLRAGLRQALETGLPARRQVPMFEREGDAAGLVDLTVEPLSGHGGSEALYLVLFTPLGQGRPPEPDPARDPDAASRDASAAETEELHGLRDRLQSTIEEYETAIEELKASNEELVSVNEEAQSSNEELEASKEEMQSLNEELTTINAELATSVDELDRANTDLTNLYAATEIAVVFLDRDLVIRNFTPAAARFFNMREADIGRPLTDLSGALQFPDLEEQVRQVFTSGQRQEHRLSPDGDGRHCLVRLMPYRTRDEGVGGVVVTIVDISSLAWAEEQQQVLISELNHRVKNMLSVVISIVNNTRRMTSSPEEFSDTLIKRLHGMDLAYSLLARSDWTQVSIDALIRTQAEIYGAQRVHARGPDVTLAPQQALSLGMVVHEMTTNAAKYGALSNEKGRVDIVWSVEDGQVHLAWTETGGPEVRAPVDKGFGFILMEGQTKFQMDGDIDIDFPPEGVVLKLNFPIGG